MNRMLYLTTILGLLLIILNIFFDLSWIPKIDNSSDSLIWVLTVISKTSSTIGLALLLGNLTRLFNKKDEQEKEEKRKQEIGEVIDNSNEFIKQTIISKDFMHTLSDQEKRNIISIIIAPNSSSLNNNSNIKIYLENKTSSYLKFFNKNFRTNFNVEGSYSE